MTTNNGNTLLIKIILAIALPTIAGAVGYGTLRNQVSTNKENVKNMEPKVESIDVIAEQLKQINVSLKDIKEDKKDDERTRTRR